MPKAKPGSNKPLAIEVLMADHRKVEDLFRQYEDAKDAEDESRRDIAAKICNELTVHATVEEEIFYPWLRETLDEDDMDMVEEAQVEHNGAKDLIAQIEGAGALDEVFDAKVKVLGEYIKHHVREEEQEIFPEVADEEDALDEMGQQIEARKVELKEELGIEDDGEEPAPRKPAKASDNRKAAPR
jgi:hemerythrin superfamily protein